MIRITPAHPGRRTAGTLRIELESRIADLTGHRTSVLTASGSTAILIALRIIAERAGTGEVILPATVCFSVVRAVMFAGFRPLFADVTLPGGTIDAGEVEKLAGSRTRAIVPVHIFGNAAPMEHICAFAASRNIAVIEDVAQATGGCYAGRPLGSYGDFAIHSFGRSKVIDAGGGGALATNDARAMLLAAEMQERLPVVAPVELVSLERRERDLARTAETALRDGADAACTAMGGDFEMYRPLYERRVSAITQLREKIELGLDGLTENLRRRRSLASAYRNDFAGFEEQITECSDWERTGVVWRYTVAFRDPRKAKESTDALRRANVHASNLYVSAARLLSRQKLPNADRLSSRVLNLWVDRATSAEDVTQTSRIISAALSRGRGPSPSTDRQVFS